MYQAFILLSVIFFAHGVNAQQSTPGDLLKRLPAFPTSVQEYEDRINKIFLLKEEAMVEAGKTTGSQNGFVQAYGGQRPSAGKETSEAYKKYLALLEQAEHAYQDELTEKVAPVTDKIRILLKDHNGVETEQVKTLRSYRQERLNELGKKYLSEPTSIFRVILSDYYRQMLSGPATEANKAQTLQSLIEYVALFQQAASHYTDFRKV